MSDTRFWARQFGTDNKFDWIVCVIQYQYDIGENIKFLGLSNLYCRYIVPSLAWMEPDLEKSLWARHIEKLLAWVDSSTDGPLCSAGRFRSDCGPASPTKVTHTAGG